MRSAEFRRDARKCRRRFGLRWQSGSGDTAFRAWLNGLPRGLIESGVALRNGFPSPPQVSFPRGAERFALRGPPQSKAFAVLSCGTGVISPFQGLVLFLRLTRDVA